MEDSICPDGGACHHNCQDTTAGPQCFRARTCGPLSGTRIGDKWPPEDLGPLPSIGSPGHRPLSARARDFADVVDRLSRRHPGVALGELIRQAVDESAVVFADDAMKAGLGFKLSNITDTELLRRLRDLLL